MSGISRGVKLFAVGFIVFFLLMWLVLNALHDRLILIQKFQYIPLPGFLSVVRTPDVDLSLGPDLGDNDVSRFWWNDRYLVVETETRPENLAKGDSPQRGTFLIDLENVEYSELGPNPDLNEVSRFICGGKITLRNREEAYSQRELELGYSIVSMSKQLCDTMFEMRDVISENLHYFKKAHNRYPDSLPELRSWSNRGQKFPLFDPWGHEYEYRNKGDDYDLWSRGPVEGGQPLMLPDRLKFPGKEWTKVSYSEMITGAN